MASSRPSPKTVGAALGYGAVTVGFGGVIAAILLTPRFPVLTGALPLLGIPGVGTAPVFNGSLLVGGVLGTGFVAYLWAAANQPFHLAAVPFLLLATLLMSFAGRFPLPGTLQLPLSVGFLVFLTLGVLLWGLGDYAAGYAGRAAAFLLLPVVHVVTWLWWLFVPWFPPGVALPQLVGMAVLAVWTLWVSADVHGLTATPSVS